MKPFISIFIFTLLFSVPVMSQSLLGIEAGYGGYLLNSENDLTILEDHPVRTFYVLGINYGYRLNENWLLSVDYDYRSSSEDGVFKEFKTNEIGETIGSTDFDYALIHHSFDLLIKSNFESDRFVYGIGPSFIITNRKLGEGTDIYDKLASSAIGVCGTFEFREPIKLNLQKMTYNLEAKMRYSHSVWFDKGIRQLDGYNQDFVSLQLSFKFLFQL